jgi:hypothetical protein
LRARKRLVRLHNASKHHDAGDGAALVREGWKSLLKRQDDPVPDRQKSARYSRGRAHGADHEGRSTTAPSKCKRKTQQCCEDEQVRRADEEPEQFGS